MSTKLTFTTIAMFAALATPVLAADRQASDDAANNALSWQMTRGAAGTAYASAIIPGPALAHGRPAHARIMHAVPANAFASMRLDAPAPVSDPYRNDFQLQGRF